MFDVIVHCYTCLYMFMRYSILPHSFSLPLPPPSTSMCLDPSISIFSHEKPTRKAKIKQRHDRNEKRISRQATEMIRGRCWFEFDWFCCGGIVNKCLFSHNLNCLYKYLKITTYVHLRRNWWNIEFGILNMNISIGSHTTITTATTTIATFTSPNIYWITKSTSRFCSKLKSLLVFCFVFGGGQKNEPEFPTKVRNGNIFYIIFPSHLDIWFITSFMWSMGEMGARIANHNQTYTCQAYHFSCRQNDSI